MPIKLTSKTELGVGEEVKEKKIQKKLQNKSKHKNNKRFSWVTAVSALPLTCLGWPPTLCWPLDLLWGQLRFWSGPPPVYFCLQCPRRSELVRFLLWELSVTLYIFHRRRVCLVDHPDLTCSLYSSWGGVGSSSLGTLPPGHPLGFAPAAALEDLGLPLWGPGMGVEQLLGLQGFWQHHGSWRLGQQEIQCSRGVWQPVLASTFQYFCLENPPDREAWQATVHRVTESWTRLQQPCMHRRKTLSFLPVATLPQWGLSVKVEQLLGRGTLAAPGVRGQGLLSCRRDGPFAVFL